MLGNRNLETFMPKVPWVEACGNKGNQHWQKEKGTVMQFKTRPQLVTGSVTLEECQGCDAPFHVSCLGWGFWSHELFIPLCLLQVDL